MTLQAHVCDCVTGSLTAVQAYCILATYSIAGCTVIVTKKVEESQGETMQCEGRPATPSTLKQKKKKKQLF